MNNLRTWLTKHGPATLDTLRHATITQHHTLNHHTTARLLNTLDAIHHHLNNLRTVNPKLTPISARKDLDCLHNLRTAVTILNLQNLQTTLKQL